VGDELDLRLHAGQRDRSLNLSDEALFTADERSKAGEWVIALAQRDQRITGGALTGSLANQTGDRWSDVDVAFGVTAGANFADIFSDWTPLIEQQLGVVHFWELAAGPALYRVYLLANGLELDIGLWPAAHFAKAGEKFRLVFGESAERSAPAAASIDHLIGLCWHHALHARAAIERTRLWEAEYYISALRDHALEIACVRFGEPSVYARGTDQLPREVTTPYEASLIGVLEPSALVRALDAATRAFLDELAMSKPQLANALAAILL
jgi:hypothetical protein